MADPYAGSGLGLAPSAPPWDKAAAWIVTALVSTKFYLLFSFVFGYSFTLQARSAERDGAGFAGRHLRRVLGLGGLGIAHAALLFPGDILMTYAVLGLVLFAVRDMAPRTAVRAAGWLVAGLGVLLLGRGLLDLTASAPADPGETSGAIRELVTSYRGDPASVVHTNLSQLRHLLGGDLLYAPHMLAAFLVGLAAGKRRVLSEPERYRPQLVRIVRWGLPIGLAGGAFVAVCTHGPLDARWTDIGQAFGVLTAPALSAAYGCGLLLVLRTRHGRRIGNVLASAGRMALTNYLTQSLVMALVFTGYGLALYGRTGTVAALAGCCVLYTAQLAFSTWLMRRFRYGPVERLLHTVTHGRGA